MNSQALIVVILFAASLGYLIGGLWGMALGVCIISGLLFLVLWVIEPLTRVW